MPMRFDCPTCGKSLSAPEAKAGVTVSCPGCQGHVRVPYPSAGHQGIVEEAAEARPVPRVARVAEPEGRRIDLAMLAVLDTLIEDPIIFKWAKQQLDGDERRVQLFQRTYLSRKKDKATAHLLNLIALLGLGGLHRFYLGDIALGIGHFLTMGFCWIGTLIDIFAINKRVNDANVKVAMQTLEVVHAT